MTDKHGSIPQRHFTVQQLAAHWEVSPSHIYNLIHSNAIRYLRIGKAIRIPINFIKEYEEAACQTATTSTDYGNMKTEFGTLLGQQSPSPNLASNRQAQDAFQQGQKNADQQNNIAPNSSQD